MNSLLSIFMETTTDKGNTIIPLDRVSFQLEKFFHYCFNVYGMVVGVELFFNKP